MLHIWEGMSQKDQNKEQNGLLYFRFQGLVGLCRFRRTEYTLSTDMNFYEKEKWMDMWIGKREVVTSHWVGRGLVGCKDLSEELPPLYAIAWSWGVHLLTVVVDWKWRHNTVYALLMPGLFWPVDARCDFVIFKLLITGSWGRKWRHNNLTARASPIDRK